MRPITLGRGVELLLEPSMLSYSEWDIRRSWLSCEGFAGCSATGGISCRVQRTERRAEGHKNKRNKKKKNCTKNIPLFYCSTVCKMLFFSKVETKENAAQILKMRQFNNILKNSEHICTYINIHIYVKHSAHMTNDELSPLHVHRCFQNKAGNLDLAQLYPYYFALNHSIGFYLFIIFFYKNLQMLNLMSLI